MNSFDGTSAMARTVRVKDVTTGSFYNIRVQQNGDYRQPTSNILDLRASKAFRFGGRKLEALIDIFNVLNANTILQAGVLTGSTYNVPTQVLPPRVARLGIKLEF
jgi:outer membrane receptor protein involved in Fe transport